MLYGDVKASGTRSGPYFSLSLDNLNMGEKVVKAWRPASAYLI